MELILPHSIDASLAWLTPTATPEQTTTPWYCASHLVHLPTGTDLGNIDPTTELQVGLCVEFTPITDPVDDFTFCTHKPTSTPTTHITVTPDRLHPFTEAEAADITAWRDTHRQAEGLPRGVVRSDHYGTRPLYLLQHPWPGGTFTQGGIKHTRVPATPDHNTDPNTYVRNGHALIETGVFLEVFPRRPSTFLRTEAATFEEAETQAWAKWTRINNCPSPTGTHEFEPRGYRNGLGFCKHCNLSATGVIDLASIGSVCVVCQTPTYWSLIPKRDHTGSLNNKLPEDIVCKEHTPGPAAWEIADALEDHQRHGTPMPDITWFAEHLPPGVSVFEAPQTVLRKAINQGRRDLLDQAIAHAQHNKP